jgi:hypothetical protein
MSKSIDCVYDRVIAEEKLKNGTKYERLTAVVFKILDESVAVVQDVRLRGEGKEASHQIDVSVTDPMGTDRVLVECKDFDTETVGISVVRDFNGALTQLRPAQGVVVSTVGFTDMARRYARDEGIALVLLRSFTESDWFGRVKAIVIQADAYVPSPPETSWMVTGRELPAPPGIREVTGMVALGEAAFYDETGTQRGVLKSLLDPWNAQLMRARQGAAIGVTLSGTYHLPTPVWLASDGALRQVTGFAWEQKAEHQSSTIEVTARRIADLVVQIVELSGAARLTGIIAGPLESPGKLVFRDQLTGWTVDGDGLIRPRL